MKRKNEDRLAGCIDSIGPFIPNWSCYDVFVVTFITAIVGIVLALVVGYGYMLTTYDRVAQYEKSYTECMAFETLSHEQCHDLALRESEF